MTCAGHVDSEHHSASTAAPDPESDDASTTASSMFSIQTQQEASETPFPLSAHETSVKVETDQHPNKTDNGSRRHHHQTHVGQRTGWYLPYTHTAQRLQVIGRNRLIKLATSPTTTRAEEVATAYESNPDPLIGIKKFSRLG